MILWAFVTIASLFPGLNVVTSFPLPAPPTGLEGRWVHDYKDAAHELTEAFQQLSMQPREVTQLHDQVLELTPLPESLPWPVRIQGSLPHQLVQGPNEDHPWIPSPWIPSLSHLHHTYGADTSSITSDYFASQIHPSASSAGYPLPLTTYETQARVAPTHAESSSLLINSDFKQMEAGHPSWSAYSASPWQGQDSREAMHFGPREKTLNEIMYTNIRKPSGYRAKQHTEDLISRLASLKIDTGRPESPKLEALPPRRLPRRVKSSGVGFPELIPLPTVFNVESSQWLQQEFAWYLRSHFRVNFEGFQDLAMQAQSRSNSFPSDLSRTFRKGNQVYAAMLPSASILVKFHTSNLIDKGNTQERALSLWTIDQRAGRRAFTLRGLFHVPIIVYHRMRNGHGKAVYIVTASTRPNAAPHELVLQLAPSQ
ncbi:uncharacterized protein UTRI_01126_B [Ustilago trichophora]|uniref:Effector family protein Eff1 n=1 Tax=Ustilago trichophora TaxID=86804 RepID=A0A5C3DWM0_9BASI|nr:uncharacterized protein UTRI_01126_B [Ustilago trichophora]